MPKVVEDARRSIEGEKESCTVKTGKISTRKVRAISSALYRSIQDRSIDHVLMLSEELLEEQDWALGVIAYDWAYRVRDQYTDQTFFIFENWLKTYITGWGDCDDFCTHAVGALIGQRNERFRDVMKWTEDPNFCVRRAAAVSLIDPIRRNKYEQIDPFAVSDALMQDDHHLVLKGYGWMLKVLSQREPRRVIQYLEKHRTVMPRVSFRYALEKLGVEDRENLMRG